MKTQSDGRDYSKAEETHILAERYGGLPEQKRLYRMTVSKLYEEALGRYYSYGIEIRCMETGETAAIRDLSTDGVAVRNLYHLCADGDVSCDQLAEVAEDFLATLYGFG